MFLSWARWVPFMSHLCSVASWHRIFTGSESNHDTCQNRKERHRDKEQCWSDPNTGTQFLDPSGFEPPTLPPNEASLYHQATIRIGGEGQVQHIIAYNFQFCLFTVYLFSHWPLNLKLFRDEVNLGHRYYHKSRTKTETAMNRSQLPAAGYENFVVVLWVAIGS